MSIFEKIKNTVKTEGDQLLKKGEELLAKAREYGEEGVEFTKEKMAIIGEKGNDVSNMIRYKVEVRNIQNDLNMVYQKLGELGLVMYKTKKWDEYNDTAQDLIDKIARLNEQIESKNTDYERLRKAYSKSYVVNKLNNDFSQSGVIIDQTVVSQKSNVVGKQLKEVLLPKEALISAIKRGDEIIIPDGNTQILAGDIVTILGMQDDVIKVLNRLNK